MKIIRILGLAILGTALMPFLMSQDANSKTEKIALFLAGLFLTVLLFPAMVVILAYEIAKKEKVDTSKLLIASPLGLTVLIALLTEKNSHDS